MSLTVETPCTLVLMHLSSDWRPEVKKSTGFTVPGAVLRALRAGLRQLRACPRSIGGVGRGGWPISPRPAQPALWILNCQYGSAESGHKNSVPKRQSKCAAARIAARYMAGPTDATYFREISCEYPPSLPSGGTHFALEPNNRSHFSSLRASPVAGGTIPQNY